LETFARGAVAAALVASGASVVAGAQKPSAPVFTAEQASAGRAVYARSCASCHMPDLSGSNEIPALTGSVFRDAWGGRSTKELFDYMAASMPYGSAPLATDGYLEVTAYILQSNGAVAGMQPLTPSTAVPVSGVIPQRVKD
jgi:mono/diheme cytochrome c family protein